MTLIVTESRTAMNTQNTERDLYVQFGEQRVFYTPESKKSIDLEVLLLNTVLYAVILLYGFDYLKWPLFLLLFYMLAIRAFVANHDRTHASGRDRLPPWLEALSEGFAVVVTPWDEPYDSVKRKHLKHHATHVHDPSPGLDARDSAHSVYEFGGFFRSFFSCLFYEEVQFFLDVRYDRLSKSRLYRLFIYPPLQLAFIWGFGFEKYLVVFLAMRLVGVSSWFVFSWVVHQPAIYRFGFSQSLPGLFKWVFSLIHGRRVTEACVYHLVHHTWPAIPSRELYRFDPYG